MTMDQSQGHDYFAQSKNLVAQAQMVAAVATEEEQRIAVTWLGQASACVKALDNGMKEALEPHKDKIKSIEGEWKPYITSLKSMVERIRKLLDDFANQQLRRQREEEARLRQQAEEKRLAEARRQEEEATRQRQEAKRLRQQGLAGKAAAAEQHAAAHQEAAQAALETAADPIPAAPAPKAAVSTAAGTMHSTATWDYEVTDIHRVPNQYLKKEVRATLVRERIKDLVADRSITEDSIPGLRLFEQAKTLFKG